MPGCGAWAELDDRNTIRPPAGIAGSAAWATTNAEVRLVRSTDSNVVERLLAHERARHDPGRVHEQVHPARLGDHRGERLRVGAVAGRPPRADVRGRRLELVGRAGGEHDVVAALHEHPPDGQPDPAAARP